MVDTELRFPVMGSDAHVRVIAGDGTLADRARRRLDDLERKWSRFRPDSEISRLNRSTGRPLVVSPETFDVVSAAIEAWRWSEGRFDPTTAPTMVAAGYDRWRAVEPEPDRPPARHLPCATPACIALDPYPRSITVPDGVGLDLGGIGKGAAADLVAAELLDEGAEGCLVNIGGDLRVAGEAPRPEGWRIDNDLGPDPARPVVGLVDGAVCTSTRTRRAWSTDLGAEHHLRDPTDGRPLTTGLRTVSVIGARAIQAEVLAKTAFAAGPAGGPDSIAGTGATGLLVLDDGSVIELDGLEPYLAAGRAVGSDVMA